MTDIANQLNKYFTNIGRKLANSLPEINEDSMKALDNVLNLIQERQKLIKLAHKSEGGW